MLFDLYGKRIISLPQALQQLGCSRPRFFQLLKQYRANPDEFTIAYSRHNPQHHLSEQIDRVIREELERDKQLIVAKDVPIWHYNYQAVRDNVVKRTHRPISAQTVRNRAHQWGYWRPKKKVENRIPREVATEAVGMLLQHDASTHRWSPYVSVSWDLITTLDDHITDLDQARLILQEERQRYNEHQVHSTTGEIPAVRFQRAVREGRTCFRPFQLTKPYTSDKDIFCLHEFRKVDGYNRIALEGYKIQVPVKVPRKTDLELHIVPHNKRTEVRMWYEDQVIKVVHFKA